jgi:hypothetical protein
MQILKVEKSSGEYEVEWNAEKLSNGIYFYALNIEGKRLSKKMCLIR